MGDNNFVHLHCHSEYSLLDGAARVDKMIGRAVELGMPALAVTDHGTMFGIIDFYRAAKAAGIKPILGCEIYVSHRSRFQKEAKIDDSQYHLVLLAENDTGYRNLMRLVSAGYLEGFYYKPRVDRELLEECSEGLIALSACLAGEIPTMILNGQLEKAFEAARYYRDLFGPNNFFLELHDHGIPEQKTVNKVLADISRKEGIPLVASNDVHYLSKEDAAVHDVLLCIQTGKTVDETDRMKFESQEFYFKAADEMADLFSEFPDAISNSLRIAERCNVEKDFSQRHLPEFRLPDGIDPNIYLKERCYEGLKWRYAAVTPEMQERLDYELRVIQQMDYANYFLIIWDLIEYAKKEKVIVGPGRGSAAGSLVAYCLGITNIEPLQHGLLFERFLNPERISMPDIDIDFCDDKRDRILQYVCDKYGQERVAQIITFGTMAARAAVRDVGRALAIPYAEVDRIAKLIPMEPKMTIARALRQSTELQALYREEQYRKLLDTSMAVEGMPRHASTHAAGVVIAREPLVNHVPLYKTADSAVVTQFPMGTLEDLGLLKMDFLGLKTLSIIGEALENIEKRHNKSINIDQIPLDDPATYEMLSQGETTGTFQLESTGMRSVLRELIPNKFEDIIAVVALYRPGPMEQIPVFVQSKHGKKQIKYAHPVLEPILNETYGVIVYQEQIMEIAARMAGFTLGQADLLRRAIGKKKLQILDEQQELFISGCMKNGYSKDLAVKIYDLILKFASYGFNKSHAAAYALIAYQTAYLKANYPTEYMAALMTIYYSNSDKVALYIADCRRMGIEILPPDINESETHFTVVGGKRIRFGLAAVKNVGLGAIESIGRARQEKPFASMRDFVSRIDLHSCNRKVLESLVKCGVFDSLGGHRAQYLAALEDILAQGQAVQRERENGQISMFSLMETSVQEELLEDNLPAIEPFTDKERLSLEKEMLGLFISGHPLEPYRPVLERIPKLINCAELGDAGDNRKVQVGGIIVAVRRFYTKKNKQMAFVKLEDLTGGVELVVFPDLFERQSALLEEDNLVLVEGRTDFKEEEDIKIIVESLKPINREQKFFSLLIEENHDRKVLESLKDTLVAEIGEIPVCLYFKKDGKTLMLEEEYWVSDHPACLERLESLLGPGTVIEHDPGKVNQNNMRGITEGGT
ncbi:MAG: DNA polymerase III subunit alpha [Bacillota bacterium]